MNLDLPPTIYRPRDAAGELLRIVRVSEEIKRIVGVTFRINIMALNAILLARRAGNAARGFGVLSSELRVFSIDLRQQMDQLSAQIHALVSAVSLQLGASRRTAQVVRAVDHSADPARWSPILARRAADATDLDERRRKVARELRLGTGEVFRLVELGSVLAKSAKIEAAYGGPFAGDLTHVSHEFSLVVEEVQASLDILRHSGFLDEAR